MKVKYTGISFDEKPVIWEYNREQKQATCLFFLQGTNQKVDKQLLLEYLSTIEGIRVEDELAIIDNTSEFSKRYHPRKIRNQVGFFPPSSELEAPDTLKTIEISLQLDKLILNSQSESDIWGKTLCYLAYFRKKIQKETPVKFTIIRSELCFARLFQHDYNKELYQDREILINEIQKLFDENLSPSFDEIKSEILLEDFLTLRKYFQNAIVQVMEFNPLNDTLTDSEQLTRKERDDIYGTPDAYNHAVHQERLARAEISLRPFIFFINSDISADSLTDDSTLIQLLNQLKVSVQDRIETIEPIINKLKDVHIKIGIEQFIFEQDKEKLQKSFKESEVIESYNSFNFLIHILLGIHRPKLKKSDLNELVREITIAVNRKIAELDLNSILKNSIAPHYEDSNFFISNAVYRQYIKTELNRKENFKRIKEIPTTIADLFQSSLENYKLEQSIQPFSYSSRIRF